MNIYSNINILSQFVDMNILEYYEIETLIISAVTRTDSSYELIGKSVTISLTRVFKVRLKCSANNVCVNIYPHLNPDIIFTDYTFYVPT